MSPTPLRPSIAGYLPTVHEEIDTFESSLRRFADGRIPEASFLEYRLRHGVYGQRQDGVHMLRSKLPLGLLAADQLEAFADLTEAYSAGVAHLTTRQDIQVHFVPLSSTPQLLRVLAGARMTSREACGNVVRNVTASEVAGIERGEAFDVTPYGMALAQALLRHPDGQSLGRKFKVHLAGSFDPTYNLAPIHDLGATAARRGQERGFHVRVGGGLGAVPHEAPVLYEWLPADELIPLAIAMLRVFSRHGEKAKRARARLKFRVAGWGVDRFREAVEAERAELGDEGGGTPIDAEAWADHPAHGPGVGRPGPRDEADAAWLRANVVPQRQAGYAAVRVFVPRGDLVPDQLRGLAGLLREHTGDTLRIGPDQSLLIRFVPTDRLLLVRDALAALELGEPGAGGIADPVACPGADSCKLGITSPRSAARQLRPVLHELATNPRLAGLRVKISGCPNACAQHHVADIGFFGAARTLHGLVAPHFTLMLGGFAGGHGPGRTPGDGFGVVVTKIPAAHLEEALRRLTELYLEQAYTYEAFGAFARRLGRPRFKALLADLAELPPPSRAPHLYREWGSAAPFAVVRGTGECAGAVVLGADLWMLDADRRADEAVAVYEAGGSAPTVQALALQAMDDAARALLSTVGPVPDDSGLLPAFTERIYGTGLIFEGVGHYYLGARGEPPLTERCDRLRRLVAEAGLFVEEAHSIVGRITSPGERSGAPLVQVGGLR